MSGLYSPETSSIMDSAHVQRRRYARHRVDAPVLLWNAASEARAGWRGHCLNLSEGGAGVVAGGPWQPGQVLKVELALPVLERPLMLVARLVHRNRLYCGLEFLGITDAMRTTLLHAVEEAARRPREHEAQACERFLSP